MRWREVAGYERFRRLVIFALLAVIFTVPHRRTYAQDSACTRIVSVAPSITELVYSTGLGDRLVGVTKFCRFPPEAKSKVSIGGFLDPNLELITALRPSVILLLSEQDFLKQQLETLGLRTLTVDHKNIEGIRNSFLLLGEVCRVSERAKSELAAFDEKISRVSHAVEGEKPVRTLVVVGKSMRGGSMTSAYVSGTDGYYFSLLDLVGAVPAYRGGTISLPTLSSEGIHAIAPEAIIDIVDRDDGVAALSDDLMESAWEKFGGNAAIDQRRILIVRDDFASVPGPRAPLLIEKLAKFLHPSRFPR